MARFPLPVLFLGGLLATGCVQQWKEFIGEDKPTALVPANMVGKDAPTAPAAPSRKTSYAPANGETALRVDAVGRKILTANPQAGLQPLFMTIGDPRPEIFHRGVAELLITEGLVKKCAGEGQLAAVLCNEMGKMVSEREALAGPHLRHPDRWPTPDVPIGNDGQFNNADLVHLAEQAKFDKQNPRYSQPVPPPDPQMLARLYLKKAGYGEDDLTAVAPLLEAARKNFALEKQIKTAGPVPTWGPAQWSPKSPGAAAKTPAGAPTNNPGGPAAGPSGASVSEPSAPSGSATAGGIRS
jgi:hypothetical protein